MEAEFESAPEEAGGWRNREPGRGLDRMFTPIVFSFCHFFPSDWGRRRSGSPARIGNASLGRNKIMYEKLAASMIQ